MSDDDADPREWIGWTSLSVLGLAIGVIAVIVFWLSTGWAHRGQGEMRRKTECMSNLAELAKTYGRARDAGRIDPTLHGSAQILSWFGERGLPSGSEKWLLCPSDQEVFIPVTDADLRAFHPADANALRVTRGLGSYAVRDFERFPIDPASTERQPILCDRQGSDSRTDHHLEAIVIAFESGDVQKYWREQLGLGPDDPIVVGPDSPSPLLRVFEKP